MFQTIKEFFLGKPKAVTTEPAPYKLEPVVTTADERDAGTPAKATTRAKKPAPVGSTVAAIKPAVKKTKKATVQK